MASKIFLDANILLNFTLKRGNYNASQQLIEHVVDGQFQPYITPAIVHITGYWLSKTYSKIKTKEILLELLTAVKVIDCKHDLVINALNSAMTDIEDALQYYTALHHKIDYFITCDKHLKKAAIPSLPVYLPEEFLAEFL
ncbi:type II toxin-antitoxin system VapC family toxin [Mucilaginibacter sp. HD30]